MQEHDEQLVRLGMLAEKYFPEDPNTSILKLRQFSELLAQMIAIRIGVFESPCISKLVLDRSPRPPNDAPLYGMSKKSNARSRSGVRGKTKKGNIGNVLTFLEPILYRSRNGRSGSLM